MSRLRQRRCPRRCTGGYNFVLDSKIANTWDAAMLARRRALLDPLLPAGQRGRHSS